MVHAIDFAGGSSETCEAGDTCVLWTWHNHCVCNGFDLFSYIFLFPNRALWVGWVVRGAHFYLIRTVSPGIRHFIRERATAASPHQAIEKPNAVQCGAHWTTVGSTCWSVDDAAPRCRDVRGCFGHCELFCIRQTARMQSSSSDLSFEYVLFSFSGGDLKRAFPFLT